jgi:hypothetical protein
MLRSRGSLGVDRHADGTKELGRSAAMTPVPRRAKCAGPKAHTRHARARLVGVVPKAASGSILFKSSRLMPSSSSADRNESVSPRLYSVSPNNRPIRELERKIANLLAAVLVISRTSRRDCSQRCTMRSRSVSAAAMYQSRRVACRRPYRTPAPSSTGWRRESRRRWLRESQRREASARPLAAMTVRSLSGTSLIGATSDGPCWLRVALPRCDGYRRGCEVSNKYDCWDVIQYRAHLEEIAYRAIECKL